MESPANPAIRRRGVVAEPVEFGTENLKRLVAYGLLSDRLKECRDLIRYEEAARERIGLIANALSDRTPIPEQEFAWLADALRKIGAGAAVDEALGLAKREGKQPSLKRLRQLNVIAWCVHKHNLQLGRLTDNSVAEGAFTLAARECEVSESTARLAWRTWGESILNMKWIQGAPNLEALQQDRRPRARAKRPKNT